MTTTRLHVLEEKIGDIRTDQAVIRSDLNTISETLATLVDLRAESLHLIRQQEINQKDHDELFERLRCIESKQAAGKALRGSTTTRVNKLERNQRWATTTSILMLGSIIAYGVKSLFWR